MEVVDVLLANGCDLKEQTPFFLTVQCGESLLIKQADESWNALIPVPILSNDKINVVDKIPFKPTSAEVGRMFKSGSWSRINKFAIDDEVEIKLSLKNMKKTKNDKLQGLYEEATRIKRISSRADVNFKTIDKKRILLRSIDVIAHDSVLALENALGRSYQSSVICDAKPEVTNAWVPTKKDEIDLDMDVHCFVEGIGERAKKEAEKIGDWKTISILDLQAFKSIVTEDDDMYVNGIYLQHPLYGGPFINLRIRNDKDLKDDNFVEKIKTLEDKLR